MLNDPISLRTATQYVQTTLATADFRPLVLLVAARLIARLPSQCVGLDLDRWHTAQLWSLDAMAGTAAERKVNLQHCLSALLALAP